MKFLNAICMASSCNKSCWLPAQGHKHIGGTRLGTRTWHKSFLSPPLPKCGHHTYSEFHEIYQWNVEDWLWFPQASPLVPIWPTVISVLPWTCETINFIFTHCRAQRLLLVPGLFLKYYDTDQRKCRNWHRISSVCLRHTNLRSFSHNQIRS